MALRWSGAAAAIITVQAVAVNIGAVTVGAATIGAADAGAAADADIGAAAAGMVTAAAGMDARGPTMARIATAQAGKLFDCIVFEGRESGPFAFLKQRREE